MIEPAGHRTVRSCSKWRVLTKPAGSRVGCVCSRVKRKTQKTLTEPTRDRVIRACSRAPRLSTGCVAQTRWKEHTEPTWHRLDRVCSREKDLDFVASLYTSMLDSPYRGEKKSLAINLVGRPAIWGESGVSMMNPTPDPPYKISRNFKLQSCGPNLSWGAIKFVRLD